jgi:hypothetical protein
MTSNDVSAPTLLGIVPVRSLVYRLNTFNSDKEPIVSGMVPDNELVSTNKTVND